MITWTLSRDKRYWLGYPYTVRRAHNGVRPSSKWLACLEPWNEGSGGRIQRVYLGTGLTSLEAKQICSDHLADRQRVNAG